MDGYFSLKKKKVSFSFTLSLPLFSFFPPLGKLKFLEEQRAMGLKCWKQKKNHSDDNNNNKGEVLRKSFFIYLYVDW